MPQVERPRPSQGLAVRLHRRIADHGPLTFRDFMDAALYDQEDGFYARHDVGEQGEFVTSPHVSGLFGSLLAAQVEEIWELLERPDPFPVIEPGAGDGTLARQLLAGLAEPAAGVVSYVAVEPSPRARARILDASPHPRLTVAASLEDIDPVPRGLVLANEVLDNLPFHILRGTAGGPAELYVASDGATFNVVEGPVSSDSVRALAPALAPGRETAVSPAALRFLEAATGLLRRGYVLLIDYAAGDPSAGQEVHGYRGQRLEWDVLSDPGSRDITAGVDFAALVRHARSRGLTVWGPLPQRNALLTLGFRDADRRAQARQVQAVAARRGIEALRLYSNRTRANLLLASGGLGDFSWLWLGVGTERPPRSAKA